MRSPFGIFRKHGAVLTAGLVGLCMFAFTLADFLRPEHFPALLAIIAFASIFYLLGQPSGKGGWYALVGAAIGLIVALFIPSLFGPTAAASTTLGKLSENELKEKMQQRQTANEFMVAVYQHGHGPRPSAEQLLSQFGDLASSPQLQQMILQQILPDVERRRMLWDRGLQNVTFAPISGETIADAREATTRTWIMAEEADNLGIQVSNAAVRDYLQAASNKKLTREKFTELRQNLKLSEQQLFDTLRYYLKAREYQILIYPNPLTPPEQMWDYYVRATVSQSLNVTPIPVSAFAEDVPEPTEAELTAFLEEYKNEYPRGFVDPQEGWTEPVELMTPAPTFGVPRKVKVAYVTANFDKVKQSAKAPTPEEVATYYQERQVDFPNPAHLRLIEDNAAPGPLTPGGPAVAQKPKRDTGGPAVADKPEYLPLDQVKEEIADILFDERDQQEIARAREVIHERLVKALGKMRELSAKRPSALDGKENPNKLTPQEISDELQAFAVDNGLDYAVTELLSGEELSANPDSIGMAVEVEINSAAKPGQPRATARLGGSRVVYQLFAQEAEDLYRPDQAISNQDRGTRYAYWKIEDVQQHAPTLDDPGIREEVVSAWKMAKARDKAKARAEELAQLVKAAETKDARQVFEGKTVTGDEKDSQLIVQPTGVFTWIKPVGNQSPIPRIGTVNGVPKAGERFMEATFRQLEVGQVGVAVNADESVYYVAQVLDRKYAEGGNVERLRESFLNQLNTPEQQTMNAQVQAANEALLRKWVEEFDKKYNVEVTMPDQN